MKQILVLSSFLLSLAACAPQVDFATLSNNDLNGSNLPTDTNNEDISFNEINISGGFAQGAEADVVVEYSVGTVVTGTVVNEDSVLSLGFTATVLN